MVMIHIRAKGQGQRSLGSKVRLDIPCGPKKSGTLLVFEFPTLVGALELQF